MRHLSSSLLVLGLAGVIVALPAMAHKTEVSGDVAGIWHLEPNHSPKAGEPAQVWIALTQQGGRIIPLEQCDCRLAIYTAGQEEAFPVIEAALESVSAEHYQGIPGAEVTFPNIGEYRLVLTGSPQAGATFTPFELSYTTVVAAGRNSEVVSAPADEAVTPSAGGEAAEVTSAPSDKGAVAASQNAPASTVTWWLLGGIGSGLAILVGVGVWLRRGKEANRH
jgi:hypothetical protein